MKLGMANYRLAMKTPAATATADSARQLNFSNARKAFDTARRIKATAEAWNNLAMIDLVRQPNPSRATISNAVAEFKTALECDTNYAPALFNLAVVYDPAGPYKYGDLTSAALAYHRYLALNPPPPHAGEVALLVSNIDLARKFSVQRPGQAPEQPEATTTSQPINSASSRKPIRPRAGQRPFPPRRPNPRPRPPRPLLPRSPPLPGLRPPRPDLPRRHSFRHRDCRGQSTAGRHPSRNQAGAAIAAPPCHGRCCVKPACFAVTQRPFAGQRKHGGRDGKHRCGNQRPAHLHRRPPAFLFGKAVWRKTQAGGRRR